MRETQRYTATQIITRIESCKGPVIAFTMMPNTNDQHLAMVAVKIRDGKDGFGHGDEYCVWYVNITMMDYGDAGCYNGNYFTTGPTSEHNRMDATCFFNRRHAEMIRAAFGLPVE